MLKQVQHDKNKEPGFRISGPFEGPHVLSSLRLCLKSMTDTSPILPLLPQEKWMG